MKDKAQWMIPIDVDNIRKSIQLNTKFISVTAHTEKWPLIWHMHIIDTQFAMFNQPVLYTLIICPAHMASYK